MTMPTSMRSILSSSLYLAALCAVAQPVPHQFTDLTILPDRSVALSLDGSGMNLFNLRGSISNQFSQLFDLYTVEVSTNLVRWAPAATLLRTNSDAHPLRFHDTNAAGCAQRFYRTYTNHLLTAFVKPTGPFPVGTVDRVLVDPKRTNAYRYSPPTNAFMVTLWYPADSPPGALPFPMWDGQLASDPGVYAYGGLDRQWATIVPRLVGHRTAGAPFVRGSGKYPVILSSHGLPGSRKFSSQILEELASNGYVIVNMDHTDCWATEFPDGRYLPGNHSGDVSGRLKDMKFLFDYLSDLNRADPLLAGRLDLERIGLLGGSYSGMLVETCRTDSRAQCVALWDATNVKLNSAGLQKPFLVALGQSNSFYSEDKWLFDKAVTNAVLLQIRGADHFTATDIAWTAEIPWGRGPALALNACFVWFFDTYLKGQTLPFPANSEIYNVQRK